MKPVLLIHGYSAEGKDTDIESIYGDLPKDLDIELGAGVVRAVDVSRWLSLVDSVTLDDVSLALERALRSPANRSLYRTGFHAVVHSTGSLVLRNWLRLYSPKPSPLDNFVHLAGANFGSGLAHIGRGQLARWARQIFQGVDRGTEVLTELEFGASKTLDMHLGFLKSGERLREDYQVQEFCMIGSQTKPSLRAVPIRYVKEDSSDSTVRTSGSNLNFSYIRVEPRKDAQTLSEGQLSSLNEERLVGNLLSKDCYELTLAHSSDITPAIPFALMYETTHSGSTMGIVDGRKNRRRALPAIKKALSTQHDDAAYDKAAADFKDITVKTLERAATRDWKFNDWNPREQYEGHAQVIFRLRDQFGADVTEFDVTIRSPDSADSVELESMIEGSPHINKQNPGTVTYYLRTQAYDDESQSYIELMDRCTRTRVEITASAKGTAEITYVPLTIELSPEQLRLAVRSFETCIIDVTLLRLPSRKVFTRKRVIDNG